MVLIIAFAALAKERQQNIQPRFAREIQAFRELDEKNPPLPGQILFIGSSSFTRWTDVPTYFPTHKILNRAFGGSSLPDLIRYVGNVVLPYKPKQVVIYCGENDFAGDPKLPAYKVLDRFETLFRLIRSKLPSATIDYVSMKPSPSRWYLRSKFIAANGWISDFLKMQPNTGFIDVWSAMLDENGRPKAGIYVSDQLHINASGYRIWRPIIEPFLRE